MSDKLTANLPGAGRVEIRANSTTRYQVTCAQPGTKIEFVVLAGQSFFVDGEGGTVEIDILNAEVPGASGVHLVAP